MFRVALSRVRADLYKRQEVSRNPFPVWQDEDRKCPVVSTSQRDMDDNLSAYLKNNPETNSYPDVINGWIMLRPKGSFVTFIKIEHVSSNVYFLTFSV